MTDESVAFAVEHVRRALLEGVRIPADLVNRSLAVLSNKLTAQETKFFAHKGLVISTRNVDAHNIQLEAADKIISMSGLYGREKEAQVGPPTVVMEVLPNGVMRLVVGNQPTALGAGTKTPTLVPIEAPVVGSPAEPFVMARRRDEPAQTQTPRRVPIPPSIWKIIHDEEVDS